MIKAGGDAILHVITDMIYLTIKKEQIPDDWDRSTIILFFKQKGKIARTTMKVLECIADTIIRQELDIDKKQFGFVPLMQSLV